MMKQKVWKRQIVGWIESLVITVLFIVVSRLVHSSLSLDSNFPWIWFAPVLIALQYGIWPTMLSLALIGGDFYYQQPNLLSQQSVQLYLLGGFLLTLVCLLFQGRWFKRIKRSEALSQYLQQRIQEVGTDYQTVLFAYHQLEHSYIAKPVSVRTALSELRKHFTHANSTSTQAEVFSRFLNVLVVQCSLEVAGIYAVHQGQVSVTPLASIGEIPRPNTQDYLIRECLQTNMMAHINPKEMTHGDYTQYVVAAPCLDQEGNVYAVLVVAEMPFLSLNDDNLQTMQVLIQYFMEGKITSTAKLILEKFPACTASFASELQRLSDLYVQAKQDSAVVMMKCIDRSHQEDYLFKIKLEARGIDTLWETAVEQNKILFILMPLTSRYGVESYKERLNKVLLKEFNIEFNSTSIRFKSRQISTCTNPIQLLEECLELK